MRILFLTETLPFPLDSGGRIKTFNTLRILAGVHEVHCHAFVHGGVPPDAAEALRRVTASLSLHDVRRSAVRELRAFARSIRRRQPFSIVRHWHPDAFERIGRAAGERAFDLVYCDHLSMVQYGAPTGLPLLYDAHNVESELVRRYAPYAPPGPRRWAAQREWRFLRACERRALGRASLTVAASEVDAALLRRLAPTAVVEAIPLAMDFSSLPYHAASPAGERVQPRTAGAEVLHLGGLHWPPNADAASHFATAILPLIRKRLPDARLTIVGRATSRQAKRLAGRPGVEVVGRAESLDDIWRRSRVLVVPLRSGSGVRVKILEAFGRGVPVVSTSVGCEGLEVESGLHLEVADYPAGFADATIALLADDNRARALSAAARAHVVSRHDLGVVGPRLLDAVRRAAGAEPSIVELVR